MQIAVASQNRRQITGHTGRCRRFWLYKIDRDTVVEKSLLELAKEATFRQSPASAPHPLDEVDVLICGGMGEGLRRRLGNRGITAIVSGETDPERAIQAYLAGELVSLAPSQLAVAPPAVERPKG